MIKILNVQRKKKILKAARRKDQITYKGRIIRITACFLVETMETRRACMQVLQVMKDPDYYTQQNYQFYQRIKEGFL